MNVDLLLENAISYSPFLAGTSIICVMSPLCISVLECSIRKPSTLQFMCLLLLQMAYTQSPKKDHDWWAYASFDS